MSINNVQTESTNLAVVKETTTGANPPPTTLWVNIEPNSYGKFSSSYKKTPRDPITKSQQLQRGMLTDEDSGMEVELDITKDHVDVFAEGIYRCKVVESGGTGQSKFHPTSVVGGSPGHFVVAANGALQAGTLLVGRAFINGANNGVLEVVAGSAANAINVAGLVAEVTSLPGKACVDVAGFRGLAGTIGLDVNGDLISVAGPDFTTMGLVEYQGIYVAGFTTNPGYFGVARIKKGGIAAGKIQLEHRSWVVGAAETPAGRVSLYFTRFYMNRVMGDAQDDKPTYAFEITYPKLSAGTTDEFEYPLGNGMEEWIWNFPLTSKATASAKMVGTKTPNISTVRNTGPSIATDPATKVGVSTTQDIARLRMSNVDETGLQTDFQSLKITNKNNVSAQKEIGALGGVFLNWGHHEVMVEAEVIFTNDQIILGVRDNRDVSIDILMRNSDFGAWLEIHAATLDSGDRKMEKNKSILVSSKATGHQHDTTGSTNSLSVFAFLPDTST